MLKYLHKFIEQSKFQFFMLHFRSGSKVDVIATDGYLMCSIGINGTHNLEGIVIGIELQELAKIELLEPFIPSFSINNGILQIASNQITMVMETISVDQVPNVKQIINMPDSEDECETTFFVLNLVTVTEFCDLIGDDMFHQKFCGVNKPIVFYGERKDWKIYMMPVEFNK